MEQFRLEQKKDRSGYNIEIIYNGVKYYEECTDISEIDSIIKKITGII